MNTENKDGLDLTIHPIVRERILNKNLNDLQESNARSHVQMSEQIRKLDHKVSYLTIWVITLTVLLLYFEFA